MADDITLTVRVRDMTRGEFAQIRQRMHGMDGDIRRVSRSASGASNETARMSQNIQGLSDRLQHLHSTGGGARSEMVHMRTTMGLLGRQLRLSARDGSLTEEEFRSLSDQLERTRLDFDHLARDVNRHSSEANTAMRAAAQQQRADQARQVADARERFRLMQRMSRAETAAYREEARRQTQIQRAATARQMADANQQFRNSRRLAQAHLAALQEEARRQAAIHQGESGRLRTASGSPDLNMGGDNSSSLNRMNSGLQSIRNTLQGVSGSSAAARRNIQLFNGDMNAMSRILRSALDSGSISRQDFDDLSTGLRLTDRTINDLRRSGDLSRSSFRSMRSEIAALRAQLRTLGGDGDMFGRMGARLLLFRRNLRDTSSGAGVIRRAFSRLGDWGLGGLMRMNNGVGSLTRGIVSLGRHFAGTTRIMKIFMLIMLLMAPAAQALAALLVAVLGGAFIALGAFALKGNAEVKAAFQDMKSTVGSVVKEAALPMKDDLVGAMRNVGIEARKMQPMLTRAFTAAGPLVDNVFGAITNFAASALPGFTTALEHSEEAMAGFRTGMGLIGKGFGDMFAIITKGNEEELARAWVTFGNEIRNALESLGEFMSTALNSGTASMLMIGIFRTLTGALNVMAAALDSVDLVLGSLFKHMADGISGFKSGENEMAKYYNDSGKSVKELKKDLSDLDKEIAKTKSSDMPDGVKETLLNSLQSERATILEAVASKEAAATAATLNHARSVSELIKQIQSLADLNRGYLDAVSAQEAAIDTAEEGYGKYGTALKFTKGQLDLTTKAAQEAYAFLSKIGQTTKEATDKAIEAKVPWDQVRERWKTGYDDIIRLGAGMNLSATDAKKLAEMIVGIPPTKEVIFKARTEEAIANLDSVATAFQSAPGEKIINVKALGQDALALLQQIGFTVTQLPDGSFQITAETADAKTNIGRVQAARDALKGKRIELSAADFASGIATAIKAAVNNLTDHNFTITAKYRTVYETIGSAPAIAGSAADAIRKQAENFGAHGGRAGSLPMKQFASGGSISGRVLEGRGTKKSDSLVARLSRGEWVMQASAVDKYGPAFMDSVNKGNFPGYAKGGSAKKKPGISAAAKAQRDGQGDLRRQMSLSRFGIMAGFGSTSMEKGLARSGGLDSLVNSLNSLNGVIKKAFSGSKESGLLKQLDRSGKALIQYEKKLTGVNKRLDSAKDKLNGLRQEANSLRESVKSNVMSATNITSAAGTDKNLTVADLMAKMTESRDKATAFSGALEGLRKKGVSKDIIQQIAEAGIEGGGLETAGSLLTASASEINSINSLQGQINQAAKAAGDSAAGAMYNAGIKAADGLVKGLTKQKKAIEKTMMDIARSMEKAIKRALGIKSPSKVMQEVGHFTAEGFAVGVKKNASKDDAWTSMLTAPPTAGGTGGASYGGGGSGTYVFPIYLGDKKLDEVVLDSNRRSVRTHGGNVQSTYGRKNG